jgi:hypothetical protein
MKRYWSKQYLLREISAALDKTMGVIPQKHDKGTVQRQRLYKISGDM